MAISFSTSSPALSFSSTEAEIAPLEPMEATASPVLEPPSALLVAPAPAPEPALEPEPISALLVAPAPAPEPEPELVMFKEVIQSDPEPAEPAAEVAHVARPFVTPINAQPAVAPIPSPLTVEKRATSLPLDPIDLEEDFEEPKAGFPLWAAGSIALGLYLLWRHRK